MSIGHLYVLFGEVSIQVLCPFFKLDYMFFGVEFLSFLYIEGINPLSGESVNMFSHAVDYCLFILLMISFAVQKNFSLM